MTQFAEWLSGRLTARLSDSKRLAAFLSKETGAARADQTVGNWMSGVSGPNPAHCRLLAGWLHVPQVDVFRAAGHITEPEPEPDAPDPIPAELRELLVMLNDAELDAVLLQVQGALARRQLLAQLAEE